MGELIKREGSTHSNLSSSSSNANLIPIIPNIASGQSIAIALNQSFLKLVGGPAQVWGTSGTNANIINSDTFIFNGTEPGSILLRIGMIDGSKQLSPIALKLASNIATATTANLFEKAIDDYRNSNNYWIDFTTVLENSLDINADGKNDTKINVQLRYYPQSVKDGTIILSPVPDQVSSPINHAYLTVPSGKNAFCFSTSGPWGSMDLIGSENGHFDVTLNNDRVSYLPLPNNYKSLISNLVNAPNIEDFKNALDACVDLNLRISINYVLDPSIYLDINKDGVLENNIYVGIIYDKNLPNIFHTQNVN